MLMVEVAVYYTLTKYFQNGVFHFSVTFKVKNETDKCQVSFRLTIMIKNSNNYYEKIS